MYIISIAMATISAAQHDVRGRMGVKPLAIICIIKQNKYTSLELPHAMSWSSVDCICGNEHPCQTVGPDRW